jgi:hypothetical protein
MGLHETKKLLHNKRNGLSIEEATHKTGENLCYTSDKGMISRINREHKKLNSLQINYPIKKWVTELNRTFLKEEIQMAKKHMKKCAPFLAIKEMKIKTTLRFHFTPAGTAIIKITNNNKC